MIALEVKEDCKIFLIPDCPVGPAPKVSIYAEELAMRNYERQFASAERIEISNQDVAKELINKYHFPLLRPAVSLAINTIYPIPDIKWEEDYVKVGRKVINNFTGNYEIIQQKVAVISPPESQKEDQKTLHTFAEMIDFVKWYSGMDREKVVRAWERYEREITKKKQMLNQ